MSSTEPKEKSKNCPLVCDTVHLGRNVLAFGANQLTLHEEREIELPNTTKRAGKFFDYTENTQQLQKKKSKPCM